MPSCDRLVATATIGMPDHVRGELGHVDGPAAADARHRLVGVGPQLLAQADRGVDGAVLDPEHLGRADAEVRVGEHAVALTRARPRRRPGPPVAIRRSASSAPRSATAPRAHVDDERRGEAGGPAAWRSPGPYDERGYPGDYRVCDRRPRTASPRASSDRDLAGPARGRRGCPTSTQSTVADRRRRDPAAAVGEFLVAVLVVQRGSRRQVASRASAQRRAAPRPDERGADVLAVRAAPGPSAW